jgi:DNA transformation protein
MKNEFADELHEVFERFGRISVRRMFGGHGVFRDGRMFGLVIDGRLYLKADAQSVAYFGARQLGPFEYLRKGKPARLSYYEAPPELFEDRDEAALWARRAWEAVLRSGRAK